ncbi:MAG: VOC family protein [Syntrophales bacterium]|nr:VOC family protein [Syntrophales bacterium]
MISRIDHVSIAVPQRKGAEDFFRRVLGAVPGASAEDNVLKYYWQLFSLGDLSRLEIIFPTTEGSFLEGFLRSRGAGVHHITLQTPDIKKFMAHLDEQGIPYFGYNEYPDGRWKEIFIHPRDAFGILIQVAEFEADDWLAEEVKLPVGDRWRVEKIEGKIKLTLAHPGGGKVSIHLERKEVERLLEDLRRAL